MNNRAMKPRDIKIKTIAFYFLMAALIASSSARAETIFIACSGAYAATHTVDLTNKTVDNVPAAINARAFDWQTCVGCGGNTARITSWHIDRVASTIKITLEGHFPNGHVATDIATFPCKVSSAPSTKF